MTRENDLKLVGKGAKKIINNLFSRGTLDYYLEECKLKVVIEEIYGEKSNVLVNADVVVKGNYYEKDVLARFKNASDMFKFLQGYYTCFIKFKK